MEKVLSQDECRQFISDYLNGILDSGLMLPLVEMGKKTGPEGKAAQSYYELMLEGKTPQFAIKEMIPSLPVSIGNLVVLGFEKSSLDLVLTDILKILQNKAQNAEAEFEKLASKYSQVNVDVICSGCWQDELTKILNRALTEKASKVYLQQKKNDFLFQKYVAVKLVQVTEPAMAQVYRTLKYALQEASLAGKMLIGDKEMEVSAISPSEYKLKGPATDLDVVFQ